MTTREPELDVDLEPCTERFLGDAWCPDEKFTGIHVCVLHEDHAGWFRCECACGATAKDLT